jgi:NifU-like protein involved in Fe-S cluster formation
VCGDVLELAVRVEGGRIVEARFLCRGCTTAIACGSWVTEWVMGKDLATVKGITAEEIAAGLGGLAEATFHGAQLAAETVRKAVASA